jgi:hypothetical protein
MGKKTRNRRKLSLKKQAPRRLQNLDHKDLAEVSGGSELTLKTDTQLTTTTTLNTGGLNSFIVYTNRCHTSGCF